MLSRSVREMAIIEPVAAGVQRSSTVAPLAVVPTQVPLIQPTCAIVAFAGLTAAAADAESAGVDAAYREVTTIKGHDAFLIEWDQLTAILAGTLDDGIARTEVQAGLAIPA